MVFAVAVFAYHVMLTFIGIVAMIVWKKLDEANVIGWIFIALLWGGATVLLRRQASQGSCHAFSHFFICKPLTKIA